MLKRKHNAMAMLAMGLLALALSGCQKEGPAEKAGKEIDKTMSQAGKQIEKMGEGIQGAARDAKN